MLVGAQLRSDEGDGPFDGRSPGFGSPFHGPRRAGIQGSGEPLLAKVRDPLRKLQSGNSAAICELMRPTTVLGPHKRALHGAYDHRVQWNGAAFNAPVVGGLIRNIGEVLGAIPYRAANRIRESRPVRGVRRDRHGYSTGRCWW